jgi:quinolinate synthase
MSRSEFARVSTPESRADAASAAAPGDRSAGPASTGAHPAPSLAPEAGPTLFGPASLEVPPAGDPATFPALQAEIRELAREQDAVILAHSYERPEVQDVADHVGDSLRLSRVAASTPQSTIVFAGVSFMAETAKILSPAKRVLLPDLRAGCSLADSITAEQLRSWKAEHRGAVVVSYVNTTAAVKAESDYCCTSSNARAVIDAIPADRQILFLPDMFLGLWLQRVTGRKLTIWLGECHVHAGIRPADVERWHRELPDAELLIHPECGCTSQVMEAATDGAAFGGAPPMAAHILSTEGMVTYARKSTADSFLIATETGILHRLDQQAPGKRFVPVNREAVCQYMKMTTLEKIRDSLRQGIHEITVPTDIAARARVALERMTAIG